MALRSGRAGGRRLREVGSLAARVQTDMRALNRTERPNIGTPASHGYTAKQFLASSFHSFYHFALIAFPFLLYPYLRTNPIHSHPHCHFPSPPPRFGFIRTLGLFGQR